MATESCILTTKDFTILEVMRDRCLDRNDPVAQILKRKLESALVVFRDDVPEDVATLSSRVSFSVDGRDPDTRVLSHEQMAPAGMFLPISTPRGAALLGLAEGQTFRLTNRDGVEEQVVLEKVHYQPEATKRYREATQRPQAQERSKPTLKLIRGAFYDQPRLVPAGSDDFDDPGPSAA